MNKALVLFSLLFIGCSNCWACPPAQDINLASQACQFSYPGDFSKHQANGPDQLPNWPKVLQRKRAECRFSDEEIKWLTEIEASLRYGIYWIIEQSEQDYQKKLAEVQRIENLRKSLFNVWKWRKIEELQCNSEKIKARFGKWTVLYRSGGSWDEDTQKCLFVQTESCG